MDIEITGAQALQLAREISKVPQGSFTVAFFPYSRTKGSASEKLTIKEWCKVREQLPEDIFSVDSDNYFLFTDGNGQPRMCYKYLIRYMAFPHDGFKLHKIKWI